MSRWRAWLMFLMVAWLTSCGGRLLRLQVGPIRIWLLVDGDLESQMERQSDWEEEVLGHIEGQALRVEDGELYLDDHHYGTVAEGDKVEIHKRGVVVGGEYRGELRSRGDTAEPTPDLENAR